MIIKSIRLGELQISEQKVITMEKPILGFENCKQFCLVEIPEFLPLLWLQAVDNPAVAFVVANPRLFFSDYRIEINSKEIAELRIADPQSVETYVVLTLTADPVQISANLQGPILVNIENNRAKQLVLVNSDYQVRHVILSQDQDESEIPVNGHEMVGV